MVVMELVNQHQISNEHTYSVDNMTCNPKAYIHAIFLLGTIVFIRSCKGKKADKINHHGMP